MLFRSRITGLDVLSVHGAPGLLPPTFALPGMRRQTHLMGTATASLAVLRVQAADRGCSCEFCHQDKSSGAERAHGAERGFDNGQGRSHRIEASLCGRPAGGQQVEVKVVRRWLVRPRDVIWPRISWG